MAKLTITKNADYTSSDAQIVYVDRIIEMPIEIERIIHQHHTIEVPIETIIERIVYIDKHIEVPIEKIIYEQKEVLVHVPQPFEVIRTQIEEKIIKVLPLWAKILMAAQTAIIILLMVIK